MDTCRANENAVYQNKNTNPESVNKLKRRNLTFKIKSDYINNMNRQEQNVLRFERTAKCKKKNHFAAVCKFANSSDKYVKPNEKIHQVEEQSTVENEEFDEEWINAVKGENNKYVKCIMHIDDTPVKFQLDTGSSVNILPEQYVNKYESANLVLKTWNNENYNSLRE